MTAMDRILIDDLPVRAFVGVPDAERVVEQELRIDLQLELDLAAAGVSDDFALAVDYAAVARRVIQTVQERPRKLIETVAEDVARVTLAEFPLVRVRIRVRKPAALAEFGARHAAVEIDRPAGVKEPRP